MADNISYRDPGSIWRYRRNTWLEGKICLRTYRKIQHLLNILFSISPGNKTITDLEYALNFILFYIKLNSIQMEKYPRGGEVRNSTKLRSLWHDEIGFRYRWYINCAENIWLSIHPLLPHPHLPHFRLWFWYPKGSKFSSKVDTSRITFWINLREILVWSQFYLHKRCQFYVEFLKPLFGMLP